MSHSALRHRIVLLLSLGAVALLVACGHQPGTNTLQPSATSPTATPQPPFDMADIVQARQLLSEYADQVWPGWGDTLPPFLICKDDYDYLVGHPNPPEGFALLPDVVVAGLPVYRKSGHLVPAPAATTWNVAGVWSVAIPERVEFQRVIDEQIGPGIINIDRASYVQAIIHEAFHAYQMTRIGGQLPDFGLAVDEQQVLESLLAVSSLDSQHAEEGGALLSGLNATTREQALQAAGEFLRIRGARWAGQPADVKAYEQSTEWTEGLARYAEISFMQRIGQPTESAHLGLTEYPTPDKVWQSFLQGLSNPSASPDGFRGRYYLLGAGQAFLLDRLMPEWKQQVFSEGVSLDGLLGQAVSQQP